MPKPQTERATELHPEASARAPAARTGCAEATLGALWNAWSAADPRAAVRGAVLSASASLAAGRDDESAWYVLLRGLEMLGEQGPVTVGAAHHRSLREAADEAQRCAFHGSPRLATVCARADGGVEAARAALQVNPAYAPAQVALGRALLRQGEAAAARAVLEAVDVPERVQGGAAALARARVETGDAEKALLAAARETNAPGPYGVEPSIPDPAVNREVDEVLAIARLRLTGRAAPHQRRSR